MNKNYDRLGTLALYLASLLWGTAFIFQKILVDAGIPPFYMIGLRMSFAILMVPMVFKKKVALSTIRRSFVMGVFLYLIFSLQTYGLKTVDPSVSAFVSSLNLVFIPILNTVIFKNKFTFLNIVSIVVALMGVYFFNLTEGTVFSLNFGLILTILCAIVIAFEIVYANHFLKNEDPIQMAGLQNIFCCILAFISAFMFEGSFPTNWNTVTIISILYLGIIASVVCYTLLLFGQKYVNNTIKVGLIMAIQPLFTTISAIIILNEQLTQYKIVGIICIIVAIMIDEIVLHHRKKKIDTLQTH